MAYGPNARRSFPTEWRYRSILGLTTICAIGLLWLFIVSGKSYLVPLLALIQGAVAALAWATHEKRIVAPVESVPVYDIARVQDVPKTVLAIGRTLLAFCEVPVWLLCGVSIYVLSLQESSTSGLFNFNRIRPLGPLLGLILLVNIFSVMRVTQWKGARGVSQPKAKPRDLGLWPRSYWMIILSVVLASFVIAECGRIYWHGSVVAKVTAGLLEAGAICLFCAGLPGWSRTGPRANSSRWPPGWLCLSDDAESVPARLDYLNGVGTNPARRWVELIWGVLEIAALLLAAVLSLMSV